MTINDFITEISDKDIDYSKGFIFYRTKKISGIEWSPFRINDNFRIKIFLLSGAVAKPIIILLQDLNLVKDSLEDIINLKNIVVKNDIYLKYRGREFLVRGSKSFKNSISLKV